MYFFLFANNEAEAFEYEKSHGLSFMTATYLKGAIQVIGLEGSIVVLFPGIQKKPEFKLLMKICKSKNLRPALSTVFDLQDYAKNLLERKRECVGLGTCKNIFRGSKRTVGRDGCVFHVVSYNFGKKDDIYIETYLGDIFMGHDDVMKIKIPEEIKSIGGF